MNGATALTRLVAAEHAFEQCEWPESVNVEAVNGWEDDGDAMRRAVFVSLAGDAAEVPSRRGEFVVSFDRLGDITGYELRGLDLP